MSAAFDAAVVGGGPAGLSAAAWLARYRRKVLLVDAGEPRNRWVDQAHGYLGFDPVSPAELRRRAYEQLVAYPTATLLNDRVTGARGSLEDGFTLTLASGGETAAARVVLATGVRDVFPDIDGFFEHYGSQAFHCPSCDGYEARDARVVVFGWGAQVAGFALGLYDWASTIAVVTDGRPFEGEEAHRAALERHGITVLEDEALELIGERGSLAGVRLRGGQCLDCDLVFFTIAHAPVHDLARRLGCRLDADGYVQVDEQGQTTVPGVYAAGDLVPGLQLIQAAAAKGAAAGCACAASLRGESGARGAPTPAPDPEDEISGP